MPSYSRAESRTSLKMDIVPCSEPSSRSYGILSIRISSPECQDEVFPDTEYRPRHGRRSQIQCIHCNLAEQVHSPDAPSEISGSSCRGHPGEMLRKHVCISRHRQLCTGSIPGHIHCRHQRYFLIPVPGHQLLQSWQRHGRRHDKSSDIEICGNASVRTCSRIRPVRGNTGWSEIE